MIGDMIDGNGYQAGDAALAFLITMCALLTYVRIGFEAPATRWMLPRMAMAVGYSIWAIRFWVALYAGLDIIVAPISMMAIGMMTGGYCTVQIRAIRRAVQDRWHPIYCIMDPSQRCTREDRIHEAMR
jgi:hypothetical protein